MSRKRDVFQLDDNDAPDADTSDAVGWSRDDGLGYGIIVLICTNKALYLFALSTALLLLAVNVIH